MLQFRSETPIHHETETTTENLMNAPASANDPAFTEQDVQALVDGQLSPADAERLRREIDNNPFLRKTFDTLMAQKKALQLWWDNENKH